jgi:hypothetical protein
MKSASKREDIDKPLAPADGEGVLLKNPIDVALNAWLGWDFSSCENGDE